MRPHKMATVKCYVNCELCIFEIYVNCIYTGYIRNVLKYVSQDILFISRRPKYLIISYDLRCRIFTNILLLAASVHWIVALI